VKKQDTFQEKGVLVAILYTQYCSFSMRLIMLPSSTLRKHIVKMQKLAKMTTTSCVYGCL